jgi:isopentenyl-diphosphate delta-isomerase
VSQETFLELVDAQGQTIGVAEKLAAHQLPGHLHRAFSVFLFDEHGRMLLQRRALTKYHSPGVWSNSCCGHPYPGEEPAEAATRRSFEELGLTPTRMTEAGTVVYNHRDPASGLVEHEFNHVFVGLVQSDPHPHPEEIDQITFVNSQELAEHQARTTFSVWFTDVLEAARPAMRRMHGTALW